MPKEVQTPTEQEQTMSSKPVKIPTMARGRRNRFFEAEGVDELISMVVELTAEISTLRERMFVTERVLEQHGIEAGVEIEAYELDDGDESSMTAERQRLLATVFRTLETAQLNAALGGIASTAAVEASAATHTA